MLAPLAGITDRSFRKICRRAGAGMVFTEMVAAEGIIRDSQKTWNLASFQDEERPIGVQLFSHDQAALSEAAARLEILKPDALDINFGCPVKKVVRRGAGAGFMEDPERLAEAVRSVVENSSFPVTVKIRSGPTYDRLTAIEAAQGAQDAGAAAITVHARTTAQGFKGEADWEVIATVKDAVGIPVIGNGDIVTADDMVAMKKQTGCDGVMIGRGSLGNPWIFSACRAACYGDAWQTPDPSNRWDLIEDHLLSAVEDKGINVGVREMRKHLGWYSKGMPGAANFRAAVFRMEKPEDVHECCRQFFQNRIYPVGADHG